MPFMRMVKKYLNHKIENSSGQEKVDFINDLMLVWDKGNE